MAQVLKEFEHDYEFTFATPDGNAPQLDINGMALSVHSIEKTGAKTLPLRMQQRRRLFDVSSFRQRYLQPAVHRKQELQLSERHLELVSVRGRSDWLCGSGLRVRSLNGHGEALGDRRSVVEADRVAAAIHRPGTRGPVPLSDRKCLQGILFVLYTGINCEAEP